ncbi:efflux transporter outer membrane subunit [Nonlabens spongiae]|nr:efflux transporter outer membrane subunit [Nonlabens spongiae]
MNAIQTIYRAKYLTLIAIALTLQSCFVAKDYVQPEMEETENLYRTDNLPQDSLSMAAVSWKEMFLDSYLSSYIEEGLQNNLDIRVAIQQIVAAEAYMKQGKAGYLPTLSTTAQATHQELSKNSQFGGFFSSIDQYELSGSLSWEADIWGKIRSNKRAGEASFLQTVAAHKAVKTELIAAIASNYFKLLALDEQLRITKSTIRTRDSSVITIKALKEAGDVTQVAVDQYIAQYNNAKALQLDIEYEIFRTENSLNLLLGRPGRLVERSELTQQEINADISIGVPTALLRNRPDVIASEYGLINAFELTNVARSNFYPSLTITGSGGFQSLDIEKILNANSLFATVVGGLTQPIFNQRSIRTQHEVAKAQQEQAFIEFRKTLLTAGNEVSNALYAYKTESEKFKFRKKEVESLRQAESDSEVLLKNGYANYLDLLTARESALNAELNVIDNKLQQLLTIVDLYEALGGGWR